MATLKRRNLEWNTFLKGVQTIDPTVEFPESTPRGLTYMAAEKDQLSHTVTLQQETRHYKPFRILFRMGCFYKGGEARYPILAMKGGVGGWGGVYAAPAKHRTLYLLIKRHTTYHFPLTCDLMCRGKSCAAEGHDESSVSVSSKTHSHTLCSLLPWTYQRLRGPNRRYRC